MASAADVSEARSIVESNASLSKIARHSLSITEKLLYPVVPITEEYGVAGSTDTDFTSHLAATTGSQVSKGGLGAATGKNAAKPFADAVEGLIGLVAAEKGREIAAEVARKLVVVPLARRVGSDDACLHLAVDELSQQSYLSTSADAARSGGQAPWDDDDGDVAMYYEHGEACVYGPLRVPSQDPSSSPWYVQVASDAEAASFRSQWSSPGLQSTSGLSSVSGYSRSHLNNGKLACPVDEAWAAAVTGGGSALLHVLADAEDKASFDAVPSVRPTDKPDSTEVQPLASTRASSTSYSVTGTGDSGLLWLSRQPTGSSEEELELSGDYLRAAAEASGGSVQAPEHPVDASSGLKLSTDDAITSSGELHLRLLQSIRSACLSTLGVEPEIRVEIRQTGRDQPTGSHWNNRGDWIAEIAAARKSSDSTEEVGMQILGTGMGSSRRRAVMRACEEAIADLRKPESGLPAAYQSLEPHAGNPDSLLSDDTADCASARVTYPDSSWMRRLSEQLPEGASASHLPRSNWLSMASGGRVSSSGKAVPSGVEIGRL